MMYKIKEDFFEEFERVEDMYVFLYLLLHSDDDGKIAISQRELSRNLDISRRLVSNAMSHLTCQNACHKVSHSKDSVTICNYDSYIAGRKRSVPQSEPQSVPLTMPQENEISTREMEYLKYMKEKYPRMMAMKEPLSLEQFDKLVLLYGDKPAVMDSIVNLDNRTDATKKWVSAYRTLVNWYHRKNN